jgi:hypothetical protein
MMKNERMLEKQCLGIPMYPFDMGEHDNKGKSQEKRFQQEVF